MAPPDGGSSGRSRADRPPPTRAPTSPGGVERAPLGEAGRALEPDDRPLVELLERARTGIRAAAAEPGDDLVDDVLDGGTRGVDVHPRRADALLEEGLAGAVVVGVGRGAVAHGPAARHAERLLVLAPVVVGVEVPGRLERACEPRTD